MWTIEFVKQAEKEFDALPESFIQKFMALFERIRDKGFDNLPRDSVKYIDSGIRELRVKGVDGIARSLYMTAMGSKVIILAAFVKKTEKTPANVVETAKKRRRELL